MDIELIIFDADGVLVDSEPIALAVLGHAARSAGAPINDREAVQRFRGLKMSECVAVIETIARRRVHDSFVDDVRRATAEAFERELKAVVGIHAALDAISEPICVASNGPMSKLAHTLKLTNLLNRFEGRIFSAYEVGHWKPHPGLFEYAARTLGADPERCVVIEDSLAGIAAARAAGMRALGYAGEDNDLADALRDAGAEVFREMARLPGLLHSRF